MNVVHPAPRARTSSEQVSRIARACKYIKVDAEIASIFAVPVEVVADIRSSLPPPRAEHPVSGVSDSTYYLDEQTKRRSAEAASKALLERLIRYGLNHDSDLGMGYEPFMARARELGLAA